MALNPLRAEDYQDPDDVARQEAESADGRVAGLFDQAWDTIKDNLDLPVLAAGLAAGAWAVLRRSLVPAETIEAAIQTAAAAVGQVQTTVGVRTAGEINAARGGIVAPGTAGAPSIVVPLVYNPATSAIAEQRATNTTRIVQRLTDTISAVIDRDVQLGMSRGLNAEQIARLIRSTVGLTDRQAQAVQSFRRLLEEGDITALDRAIRDRRFDASIRRAIEGNTSLTSEAIDKMVDRYAERFQAYRAMTIARTETLRAANEGRRAAWIQYAERSGRTQNVRRFWQTAADERVCPICREIPALNAAGVALDGMYVSSNGMVDLPPEHTNCRCTERFEVVGNNV